MCPFHDKTNCYTKKLRGALADEGKLATAFKVVPLARQTLSKAALLQVHGDAVLVT